MAKTDRGSHEAETEFRAYKRWRAQQNKQMQELTPYMPPLQPAMPTLDEVLPTIVPFYKQLTEALKEEYDPTKS